MQPCASRSFGRRGSLWMTPLAKLRPMPTYTAAPDRYASMQYRRAGRSGLDLPAISIGGWHNFEDLDFARRVLCRAFDLGVTQIDVANNYGAAVGQAGIAETHVGVVLNDDLKAHRDEIIVASK